MLYKPGNADIFAGILKLLVCWNMKKKYICVHINHLKQLGCGYI